jgi:hypothetical protein
MVARVFCFVGVVLAAAAVGCGSKSDSSGAGSGGSAAAGPTSGSHSTGTGSTFDCCLNGAHFSCPSQGALDQCFNMFDPSQCMPDGAQCGTGPSGPSGSGPSGPSGSGPSGTGPTGSTGSGTDDLGNQCQQNSDCMYDACLFVDGAQFGYCSKTCMDFTECPTFWDCTMVGNASGLYCVQN